MKILPFLFATFFLVACGTSEHAGGSGVEIPNSVTMVATHSDGTPVKQGTVKIISDSRWMYNKKAGKSVVLDSMQTDSSGGFSFYPPEAEKVRIEILTDNEGVSILFDSTESSVTLSALGSIQFQWKPGALVTISGTSFSQVADQTGNVHFNSIPGLKAVLVGEEEGIAPAILTSFTTEPGLDKDIGQVQALPAYLLIDDFEGKSRITKLAPYTNESYWFSIADEQQGGSNSIYPSTAKAESWDSAVSDLGAFMGNSLKVEYSIQYSESASIYAILGCTLGEGLNGNAIDSISFMALTDAGFSLFDGAHTLMHGYASANSDWQRYSINRKTLDSLGVDSTINILQFVFTDSTGTVFRLDDFIVYGNPFEMLVRE